MAPVCRGDWIHRGNGKLSEIEQGFWPRDKSGGVGRRMGICKILGRGECRVQAVVSMPLVLSLSPPRSFAFMQERPLPEVHSNPLLSPTRLAAVAVNQSQDGCVKLQHRLVAG